MGAVVTLFRIRGVAIRLHLSWLFIVGLITWSLSVGYFPQVWPEASRLGYWVTGLLAAVLLFATVLLHELSHALVALANGVPVSSITLHVFGGMSQLEREPDHPGIEFVVAVVGPITSFALAGVLALAALATEPGSGPRALLRYLATVNLVVGVFNLVPGFPLDGGRILRAALWRLKGDLQWATRMAAGAGSGFALLLIAFGILRSLSGEFLGGLWLVMIGLFLQQAARASYEQLTIRQLLAPLRVRDVMTREVIQVPPELSIDRAVDDVFWRHHVSSLPLVDHGHPVGILALRDIKTVPRERWSGTSAQSIMRPLNDTLVMRPSDSVWDALQRLSRNGLGRAAVLDNGRLVGYLSMKDILHILTLGLKEHSTWAVHGERT
jgi:Zn-dependent protease